MAPTMGVTPSSRVTRPRMVPGGESVRFAVVAEPATTTTPEFICVAYCAAEARMSYAPGTRFAIEYVPSPNVLVDPFTIPDCNASTNAPLIGTPSPARVTVPVTLPDVVVKVTLLLTT